MRGGCAVRFRSGKWQVASEDRSARTADGGAGGSGRPRLDVLDVPPRRTGVYPAGEAIRLGVTLVGRARVWSPWIIAAVARIGRRAVSVESHPLSLARLTAAGPGGTEVEIDPATFGIGAVIPELSGAGIVTEGPPPASRAIVGLMTPADLQQRGRRLGHADRSVPMGDGLCPRSRRKAIEVPGPVP